MKKHILILLVCNKIFAQATFCDTTNMPQNLKNGLVAFYPFCGNAQDKSGNGNTCVVSGATITTDRNGNLNSAYSFDGITNSLLKDTFSTILTNNFSISAWIKPIGNKGTIPYDSYIGYGYSPSNHMWNLGYHFSQKKFDLWNVSGASWMPSLDITNQWAHVVHVFTNTTEYIYVNGQLLSQRSVTLPLTYRNSKKLWIGAFPSDNQYFYGDIDDIFIYNRVLTQNEITKLFKSCFLSTINHPANQVVNISGTAMFYASCSDTNATFQWQTDIGFGYTNLSNAGQYSGVTNDTLLVSSITNGNNNQFFRCIISSGPNCKDTTSSANITISTTSVIENKSRPEIVIYPNPAKDLITIQTNSKQPIFNYIITDVLGKEIVKEIVSENSTTNISIAELPIGVYMLFYNTTNPTRPSIFIKN